MARVFPVPDVLRWARESSNYPIEEIARRMNLDVAVIESWERGEAAPTYRQLERLADYYKRPVALFFFPSPPPEERLKEQFRTLPDFVYDVLSPRVVYLIRRARAMRENLIELFDGRNPAYKNIVMDVSISQKIPLATVAGRVRSYLGITLLEQTKWKSGRRALSWWRDALEQCGVFVFKDTFQDDTVSGFCLYDREFPIIYINSSMPDTRQVFTLFHELAHLLFRTGGIDSVHDSYISVLEEPNRYIESFCNAFAGAFLVPDDDFRRQLVGWRRNDDVVAFIEQVASRYSVSREVILRKLYDRGLVSQDMYDRLAEKWIKEAREAKKRSRRGSYYNRLLTYLGRRYINAAFDKYHRGQISVYELSEYLGVKRIDAIYKLETVLITG